MTVMRKTKVYGDAFGTARFTSCYKVDGQRHQEGKSLMEQVPLESHSQFKSPPDRKDPLEIGEIKAVKEE